MGISTNPKNFTEGLFDDVVATLTNGSFTMYDYDGKANPAPCFKATLKPEDSDKEFTQY